MPSKTVRKLHFRHDNWLKRNARYWLWRLKWKWQEKVAEWKDKRNNKACTATGHVWVELKTKYVKRRSDWRWGAKYYRCSRCGKHNAEVYFN